MMKRHCVNRSGKGGIANDGASSSMTTHSVDILAFIEARQIPFLHFETPYYLSPPPGDEKIYALLRETLDRAGKIGIARVVINTRPHLAALVPCGRKLVLSTFRWSGEAALPADSAELADALEQSAEGIIDESEGAPDSTYFGCVLSRSRCIAGPTDRLARPRQREIRPRARIRRPTP